MLRRAAEKVIGSPCRNLRQTLPIRWTLPIGEFDLVPADFLSSTLMIRSILRDKCNYRAPAMRWKISTYNPPLGLKDSAVSRITSLCEWILRLPIVWGGVAALAFYAMLSQKWIDSPLLEQYMAGHRVEYIVGSMFFVGLAAVVMRALEVARQFRALDAATLGPVPTGGQSIADCDRLLHQLAQLPAKLHDTVLARRLREALEFVRRKESADSLDQHLRHLEDLDAFRMQSSYNIVRIIIWAIPILGLLGTVIGITMAVANLNPQTLEESTAKVTAGLGVAFDHTAEALALTMVLMFIKSWVERMDDRLLSAVDARASEELVGRFQEVGVGNDPNVAVIRRMSEQVIEAVEAVAIRQAEVWKSTIDEAHHQWAEVSVAAGEIVKESFSTTLRNSLNQHASQINEGVARYADRLTASAAEHTNRLDRSAQDTTGRLREGLEKLAELLVEALHQHGEVLTNGEKELADENRQHLSEVETALTNAMVMASERQERLIRQSEGVLQEMQTALVDAAENTVRQQEQLVKQGEVLLRVVDASGQIKRLEDTLNENLAAVQRAGNFEDMALNLSAAIQMLGARVSNYAANGRSREVSIDDSAHRAA